MCVSVCKPPPPYYTPHALATTVPPDGDDMALHSARRTLIVGGVRNKEAKVPGVVARCVCVCALHRCSRPELGTIVERESERTGEVCHGETTELLQQRRRRRRRLLDPPYVLRRRRRRRTGVAEMCVRMMGKKRSVSLHMRCWLAHTHVMKG